MGAPDPLDATLSPGDDLLEGFAGQVSELHTFEVGPQCLDRVQLGRIAGQRLHHQPVPLAA